LSVLRTKYHLTLMRLKPKIMHQHERGYLIIPHEVATGADCDGCIIVEERGDMADLKCNSCGAVRYGFPLTAPAIDRWNSQARRFAALAAHTAER